MSVTPEGMLSWCRRLIGGDSTADLTLEDYLAAVPRLDTLCDLPEGTPVLVRGDTDCKPGEEIGQGDVRLRSMVETLKHGQQQGWKQIVFGHIGRKPEGSLDKVAARLGQLLECDVPLISDWLDESSVTINASLQDAIATAAPGSVMVLENTRRYAAERLLWKAKEEDLPTLVEPLSKLANEFAEKVASVYVNEAFAAGSLDASSTVVPAAMQRVALGKYITDQLEGPLMRCVKASLVVFSGLKIDKLDDLEAMIDRGAIRWVFSAGSLAMALKKAAAQLDGKDFCMGVAEDPAHADKPYYIPPERIEQAKQMVSRGRASGVRFILPIDFILQDGQASETIGPADQQFDIGPKTSALFEETIGEYLSTEKSADGQPPVAFHNGVFGMFEDSRFEDGTRRFIAQLKRLTDAGVEVYVGGGEGGKALDRYGQPEWITHCFTAGGTVLNALGSDPIPYLVALRMAAVKQ